MGLYISHHLCHTATNYRTITHDPFIHSSHYLTHVTHVTLAYITLALTPSHTTPSHYLTHIIHVTLAYITIALSHTTHSHTLSYASHYHTLSYTSHYYTPTYHALTYYHSHIDVTHSTKAILHPILKNSNITLLLN